MRATAATRTTRYTPALLGAAVMLASAGMASADGNSAYILQDSADPADGNSLTIDQTEATNSIVAGVRAPSDQNDENVINLDGIQDDDFLEGAPTSFNVFTLDEPFSPFNADLPAAQFGSGNTASLTAEGDGAYIGLYQDGNGNEGTILADGDRALASLYQLGNDNRGALTVSGNDAEGFLGQIGNNNDTSVSVDTNGASVSYRVEGNGTTFALPASVVSTSGTGQITITQRPLP